MIAPGGPEICNESAFCCSCEAEPHITLIMLDQGGCGYNNFEYVSGNFSQMVSGS